jgi:hypothetical protein
MNKLLKIALTSTSLLLTTNAIAAKPLSQNQKLTQCKALASSQFENVSNVRSLKIKNARSTFSVKFRVVGDNDRGMFLCTIEKNQEAQIARLDKTTSEALVKNN